MKPLADVLYLSLNNHLLAGATGPLLPYWDPLGFSSKASPEKFARWRATEIKHGRIAMMATVGTRHASAAAAERLLEHACSQLIA